MTRGELDRLLERLLKETQRRRGLGGYSTDAPAIFDLYDTLAQLTLQLIHLERLVAKRPSKRK